MVLRIAQRVEHHHAVGHRRKDRAEPVLAVEPLADQGDRRVDRALPRPLRRTSARPRAARRRRRERTRTSPRSAAAPCGAGPSVAGGSRNSSSMRTSFGLRARGLQRHQHQQRHDDGAAPIRNLVEMERKPPRQQHDLDRHHRHRAPRHEAEQRQHALGEDVGAGRAAARAGSPARARAMCGASMSSPIIFSAK